MGKHSTSSLRLFFPCLVCTFLWGLGYPILKIACTSWNIAQDDIIGKLMFAGWRFSLSGIVLLAVSWKKHGMLPVISKKMLPRIGALGLCQTTLQYALLYIGMANTSGTKGSVINQFCVFLTVLLSPVFFRNEKFSFSKTIGCIVGFAGIIVMNLDGASLSFEYGDVIVLLASCATTAGYLLSKAIPTEYDAMTSTGYQQLFGGAILIVIGVLFGGKIRCDSIIGLVSFAYMVIECAVAFSIWLNLLQHNDASSVIIYKFLTPVFGVLFSALLLDERILTFSNFVSLVLVCTGILIVNGFNFDRRKIRCGNI